jgi:hypothetical protein
MTPIQKILIQYAACRYRQQVEQGIKHLTTMSTALTPNVFSPSPFDLCPGGDSGLTSPKFILFGHGIWLGSGFDLFLSGLACGLLVKIAQNLSGLASGLHLHRLGSYYARMTA